MSYKPVVCELKLLKKDFVPALKAVFTNKISALAVVLSVFFAFVLRTYIGYWAMDLYAAGLIGVLMLLLRKECISMEAK